MAVKMNPYLGFKDNAREAMEFYKSVFGGELQVMTFKQMGAADNPAIGDLVMHSVLDTDNGMSLMASDMAGRIEVERGNTYSVSLSGDDHELLSGYFKKLSDGGTVTMPLEKSSWDDTFGMVTDRFGTSWLVNIAAAK